MPVNYLNKEIFINPINLEKLYYPILENINTTCNFCKGINVKLIYPCSHIFLCNDCANKISNCPICGNKLLN